MDDGGELPPPLGISVGDGEGASEGAVGDVEAVEVDMVLVHGAHGLRGGACGPGENGLVGRASWRVDLGVDGATARTRWVCGVDEMEVCGDSEVN